MLINILIQVFEIEIQVSLWKEKVFQSNV